MGYGGRCCLLLLFFFFFSLLFEQQAIRANVVFQVRHKFGARSKRPLKDLRAHDMKRHAAAATRRRMLSEIDFQLGGDNSPTSAALYYTKLTIGTPPVDYHVQVDTGSDILWVNCINCVRCPTKSDLDIPLRQYNISASSSGTVIGCDQDFCDAAFNGQNTNCKVGMNCEYSISYGDGSKTEGYFVRDTFRFDKVNGNLRTGTMNDTIAFGCSAKQGGELGSSSQAVDGIVGFGQSNTSMLSQLASSGKAKKIFSHCLDGNQGGGIFAIGEVVHPKVNGTALVPNSAHYNVVLQSIDVGGRTLSLPLSLFGSGTGGTIIDSGTTLAYLPSTVYQQVLDQVMSQQPTLKTHVVEDQFTCFWYNGNVDDGFPVVRLHCSNALPMSVYPHDYLFEVRATEYCIGWQSSGMQTRDGKELTLLGDIVLADKLVVYDIENQTVGWISYNCSSSIRVRDENSGNVYSVGFHNISCAFGHSKMNVIWFVLVLIAASLINLIQ